MTAPLPGIRPGQIWMSRQVVKGGAHERVEVTGCGPADDVYAAVFFAVLSDHGKPARHRQVAREHFEERYTLVSEPGVVSEDG